MSAKVESIRPSYDYGSSLEAAFPNVDPEFQPWDGFVLLQMRTPKRMSAGGIVLVQETRDTDQWNTQVAKVIGVGPVAFRNKDTGKPWVEGICAEPGMYVRCPKYGGDRFEKPIPGRSGESALFVIYRDHELIGRHTGDPLAVVAFI
jgi:co-chaperonin GroES (HSP10)